MHQFRVGLKDGDDPMGTRAAGQPADGSLNLPPVAGGRAVPAADAMSAWRLHRRDVARGARRAAVAVGSARPSARDAGPLPGVVGVRGLLPRRRAAPRRPSRCCVLLRPAPWLLLMGIAGNLAIVGMYVLSRTNGPPLGPHAGRPEAATAFDLACTAAELGAIAASIALLPPVPARRTATALALAGAGLWAGRLTGVLL